jgi:nucleotide-binding universal stress UspA family protein
MQRFKKILFYYRNAADHPALDRAAQLAKRNQARLTVVEVLEDLPRDLGMANHGTPPTDPVTSFTKERQDRLQHLAASLMEDGSQIKTTVLVGTPFPEITREVLRDGYDLVIMTAECPLGLKKVLFGSTSMHLMRKCPCPVWVMKPEPRRGLARILAAVAPDPFNHERDVLNTTIMDLASSLTEREDAELHVVHVWQVASGYRRKMPFGWAKNRQVQWDRSVREHTKTALFGLLDAREDGIWGRVHLLKGRPANLIPKLAEKEKVDLIVMGTVCRTGVPGVFMGNTAESILQQVECSVLTIKPDGFVTPVAYERFE